jgi:hypothetical protein
MPAAQPSAIANVAPVHSLFMRYLPKDTRPFVQSGRHRAAPCVHTPLPITATDASVAFLPGPVGICNWAKSVAGQVGRWWVELNGEAEGTSHGLNRRARRTDVLRPVQRRWWSEAFSRARAPRRPRHQLTRSRDHQITRSPDHEITRSPDHQITRSPLPQISSIRADSLRWQPFARGTRMFAGK